MTRQFDRVAASMYLSEAYELMGALLYRLQQLEGAAKRWCEASDRADAQVHATDDEWNVDQFNEALRRSGAEQSTIFEEVEAFLAAWARLSLLFWPAPDRKSPRREFTMARGVGLRRLVEIDDEHALNDRSLRNAWMHADERFDHALLEGRLGNRQQFVRAREVEARVERCPRVIDVENLTVHFRAADGSRGSHQLRPLKAALEALVARRHESAKRRLVELPAYAP